MTPSSPPPPPPDDVKGLLERLCELDHENFTLDACGNWHLIQTPTGTFNFIEQCVDFMPFKALAMTLLMEQNDRFLSDDLMVPDESGEKMLYEAEYLVLHKRLCAHIFDLSPLYILTTQVLWLESKKEQQHNV